MLPLPRAALATLASVLVAGCGAAAPPQAPVRQQTHSAARSSWGGPVSAPDDERAVRALLVAAARGDPEQARAGCARFVVTMPGLWRGLLAIDPTLDRAGLQRVAEVKTGDGRRHVPVLVFMGQHAELRLLASPAFVSLARHLAGGFVRPASEQERKLVFQLVGGFEPGTRITVAQTGGLRLALLLDHGHVFWMELLSAWQPSEWAVRSGGPLLARSGDAP